MVQETRLCLAAPFFEEGGYRQGGFRTAAYLGLHHQGRKGNSLFTRGLSHRGNRMAC